MLLLTGSVIKNVGTVDRQRLTSLRLAGTQQKSFAHLVNGLQ